MIDLNETFLPIGPMRLIDRVTHLSDSTICGEVDIGPCHWVYEVHFPSDPIFPGSLIVEAAGQLVALWAWSRGRRGRPRLVRANATFRHPVDPTYDCMQLRAELRDRLNLTFAEVGVWIGDAEVASVDTVLAILSE